MRKTTAKWMTPEKRPQAAAVSGVRARSALKRVLKERDRQAYVLRLYVAGLSPASGQAIEKVRGICEEKLKGRYELEVFDIYQLPALAKDDQIVATPTLVKVLPSPLRRFIGSLRNVESVLFGLDLRERLP